MSHFSFHRRHFILMLIVRSLLDLMIHLNQVLPRRAWTRKVPLFLKDPNQCTIVFNEELHETVGTARVVKTFSHFSSSVKKNGTSSRTICEKFYKTDGLHPNRTGSKLLGALISKCVYKAMKSGKAETLNVLSEAVPVPVRSVVENRSKAQTISEIHQPKSTLPRMIIRNSITPPPPMDDIDQYPPLPNQPQQLERGVSGTDGVLFGYNEAVKKVVVKKTTPPPKVRENRTCKYMIYFVKLSCIGGFIIEG